MFCRQVLEPWYFVGTHLETISVSTAETHLNYACSGAVSWCPGINIGKISHILSRLLLYLHLPEAEICSQGYLVHWFICTA